MCAPSGHAFEKPRASSLTLIPPKSQHLTKTPNEYIRWRYASGEDREGVDSVFRKVTDEEAKKMAEAIKMPDGTKKVVDKLLGRRKLKKSYEYEVQWVGLHSDNNEWLTRDKCVIICSSFRPQSLPTTCN